MAPSEALISIIVPVFNEASTVAAVVNRLLEIKLPAPREIIVVNDGSTDGTRAALDGMTRTPVVDVIHGDRNRGKGHAVRLGLSRARGSVIAIQDADFELDPAQLADLVTPVLRGEADAVYGSRFLLPTNAPFMTVAGNRVLTAITNLLFRSSLTDMETCYKIIRADVAKSLVLSADRFEIEPEITARLLLRGYRIVERPVRFDARSKSAGKKMRWRDGWMALRVLLSQRLRGRMSGQGRPPRVLAGGTAIWIAAAAAVVAAAVGVAWGTHVAGGADSYCYLNQAELFASGHIMHFEPLAERPPWPRGSEAFVPVGHDSAFARPGASVPMCPPGYPVAMAIARIIGGRTAMFAVVPFLGAVAVWLTFVLGRRVAGPSAGAVASVLMAASPPFLYQVVQPMSDVPAAALWATSLVAVTHPRFKASVVRGLLGGIATGAALLVRPNLLPVIGAIALGVFIETPVSWRAVVRTWVAFAAGLAPFALLVAALQSTMFGGALKSGYGDLDYLFRFDHIWPNLQRYPVWLLRTETPIVLLALATPWIAVDSLARRRCVWLLTVVAAVFACYIPYIVFDAWWYLRFILPAYPALLVVTATGLMALLDRMGSPWRAAGFAAVALIATFMVRESVSRSAFDLWEIEHRFRLAGEYVASHLPANALVIAAQESGSVRFYSGRLTLTWRELPAGAFDDALAFARAHDYRPYLLLETGEQQDFVQRFEGKTPLGSLGWPPIADIDHEVRIYDPSDYERYREGIPIRTDRVWTKGKVKRWTGFRF